MSAPLRIGQGESQLVMGNRMHGVPRDAAEAPAQTVCTGETLAVVALRRNGQVTPAEETPAHTVCAGGEHHALVMRNNTPRGDAGQMTTPDHEPVRTLTTSGTQSVIFPYANGNVATAADEQPSPTLTTRDRIALLVPAGGGWADRPTLEVEPVPTQTATESRAVVFTDEDIDACRFRMFALHEIAGAMALRHHVDGTDYVVTGNKRERMAQYGNAVTPPAMALIVSRLLEVLEAETFTDMFCGAGGSSLGAELAGGRLRLALNHWQRAIETHATNFGHADHDCEDVSSLTTAQIRRYPDSDILMASPECTNHSLAKGARRRKPQASSLFDDGPAGDDEQDRSRATMWDVVRFAEQKLLKGKPYKAIVVENVVDAFKWGADDNGQLFAAWLNAMDALGYEHEIVWLNSMFAHAPGVGLVPQSRDRMYPVFWRKGIRRPNLRFDVPAWCPHCARVVDGRQAWKRPDRRPWGRYGPQYLYACVDCSKPAIPGALPAAAIIDRTLPAERIGDRARPLAKNTRERIRRGLERVYGEPFAIRLTHGGVPRTMTLPLVTLTQRHDMAMVTACTENAVPRDATTSPAATVTTQNPLAVILPVAGNTHERTPGNRARDAETRPLDTVHGTLDRALVVPPMGSVDPRPAATAPAPTQATTTRAAVVEPEDADAA